MTYKNLPKDYAEQYGVTTRTIHRWMQRGYPLDDPKKLMESVAGQKNPGKFEPTDLKEAKLKKILIEIEAAQFKLEVARREYVSADRCREILSQIGATTRAQVARYRVEAPLWEGLPAPEIQRRADKIFDDICKVLSDPTHYTKMTKAAE